MALILKQLRKTSEAFEPDSRLLCGCLPGTRNLYGNLCRNGYHGIHSRVRTKARSRHHGNKTGQSGK